MQDRPLVAGFARQLVVRMNRIAVTRQAIDQRGSLGGKHAFQMIWRTQRDYRPLNSRHRLTPEAAIASQCQSLIDGAVGRAIGSVDHSPAQNANRALLRTAIVECNDPRLAG